MFNDVVVLGRATESTKQQEVGNTFDPLDSNFFCSRITATEPSGECVPLA